MNTVKHKDKNHKNIYKLPRLKKRGLYKKACPEKNDRFEKHSRQENTGAALGGREEFCGFSSVI